MNKLSIENNHNKMKFYKDRIISKIDEIKDSITDTKYRLYKSMIDNCDDYEELLNLAEIELQIEMFVYIEELHNKLEKMGTSVDELKSAGESKNNKQLVIISSKNRVKTSDNIELSNEDIIELMEDDEATAAMAMMLSMQLANQPLCEKYHNEIIDSSRIQDKDDENEVSIYDLDKLDTTELEESLFLDEDDEDEIFESIDSMLGELEDAEDNSDEDDDDEDDYDEYDINNLFIDEEDTEEVEEKKKTLQEIALEDDDEDDDFIDLDNTNNNNEEDIDELDDSELENLIFGDSDDEDEDDDFDIDMGDIIFEDDEDDDGFEIDEEDQIFNSDDNDDFDIDDNEIFASDNEDNEDEDEDDIDFDDLIFEEDTEDDNENDEDDDEIDIDSLFDDSDSEDTFNNNDENDNNNEDDLFDDDIDTLDVNSLFDDSEEDTESEENDEDIFDIDESELFADDYDGDKDEDISDDEYSDLFGQSPRIPQSTSNQIPQVPVRRQNTVDKIFMNGTDRGKKSQDTFNMLNKTFNNGGKLLKGIKRKLNNYISSSDMYNLNNRR